MRIRMARVSIITERPITERRRIINNNINTITREKHTTMTIAIGPLPGQDRLRSTSTRDDAQRFGLII